MELTNSRRLDLSGLTRTTARLLCILGTAVLMNSCVEKAKPEVPGPTILAGRVVFANDTNRGAAEVLVRAVGTSYLTTTDSTGWFSMQIEAATGEILQLSLSKVGYNEEVRSLTVTSGVTNSLPSVVQLSLSTPGGDLTSGPAAGVVLKSISESSIGVRHTGGSETALLVFEVRDSQGRPVGYGHRATVQFTVSQISGGGAVVTPDTVSTDASGLASVTLTAGTLAQSVQVRARVLGTSIYSDLVRVAIHGGLPHAQHFSFAVEKVNVPGLLTFGIIDRVTAFVGDRYGNPVPTGTTVYFSTTGGIIQGSAITDDHGRASVDLLTAEPLPNNSPAFSESAGVARISVQTVDENQAPIVRSALAVVFTGHSELLVSPTTFSIPINGWQDFTVTVRDKEHHNPLGKGSTISFATSLGTIGGESTFTLPDTRDAQYTSFTFRLENSSAGPVIVGPNRVRTPLSPLAASRLAKLTAEFASMGSSTTTQRAGISAAVSAKVTVTVTSPNGDVRTILSGTLETP